MYVQRNNEAHSRNPPLRRRVVSITYYESMSIAFTQHAKRITVLFFVTCALSGFNIFLHIISQTAQIWGKIYWTWSVLILCTAFVRNTSQSKKNAAIYKIT